MPKSIRVAIEQYEQMASLRHGVRPRLVCNVRQRPSYMDPTDMVPALLRRSLLWSLSARRPLLSEEHVEIMGYRMFDPRPCAIADVLRYLTDGERRSVLWQRHARWSHWRLSHVSLVRRGARVRSRRFHRKMEIVCRVFASLARSWQ